MAQLPAAFSASEFVVIFLAPLVSDLFGPTADVSESNRAKHCCSLPRERRAESAVSSEPAPGCEDGKRPRE